MAEYCRDQAGLDRVFFVPAAMSPLKPVGPQASDRQRIEMISLAIAGNDNFELRSDEIVRGGVSYTADTLQSFRDEFPEDELFLIIGADSLEDFSRWRDPERICQLAIPLVVARHGHDAKLGQLKPYLTKNAMRRVSTEQIEFPLIEISSTEIRDAVQAERSIRYRLPRSVEKYIQSNGLYRREPAPC